jgi:hypothetical protein
MNQRGNQERTIQRHWQHLAHKTQDKDKKQKQKTKNKKPTHNVTQKNKKMSKHNWL